MGMAGGRGKGEEWSHSRPQSSSWVKLIPRPHKDASHTAVINESSGSAGVGSGKAADQPCL